MKCLSCDSEVPPDSQFCLRCGCSLAPDAREPNTETETLAIAASVAGPAARPLPSASRWGRFLAGTLVGGRYRVIRLVGRGGMGEVYQAADLKLDQPVALKFLPDARAADPAARARLANEVRIARQVTHAGVCRVYDIGEVDGLQYISMEYIDGEDLASLLRRIGRVPAEKALDMTRRLCGGLAAAHEKGILHRDLKPGNIMIDGSGRVRITDFGLAGMAEHFHSGGWQSGTPQYMAPEQLEGRAASIRSDIYSLGLVLYELFTGKQPFETTQPTRPSRERALFTRPSEIVSELDPVVERVILSCLDPDPRNRPASAYAVLAALPGGDPLATALAAGATPSPETVALSGAVGGLSVFGALACFFTVIAGLIAVVILSGRAYFFERVHLEKSPEVLAQQAGDWIRRLGYPGPATDVAWGFAYANGALAYLERAELDARRWSLAAAGHPSPLVFWYRESPQYLTSSNPYSTPPGLVSANNPWRAVSGMVGLTLDPHGKLLSFYAIPPQREPPDAGTHSGAPGAGPPEAAGALIFDAAGLDETRFVQSTPTSAPPVAFDLRRAWTGSYADEPDSEVRLEAAYWHGHPTWIELTGPWSGTAGIKPAAARPTGLTRRGQVAQIVMIFVFIALLVGGALVARHNVRAKRSDRRGAMRLAVFVFCMEMLLWCLGASHVPTIWETALLVLALGRAAYTAGLTWLLYLGLEPFVRRRWPQTLVSWTRVLSGRIRDPLVGAHILLGVALGTLVALLFQIGLAWNHGVRLSAMVGIPSVTALLGGRHVVERFVFYLDDAISKAMTTLFVIFVLRLVVRSTGVAAALSGAVLTFLAISWTPPGVTETSGRGVLVPVVVIGAGLALMMFALTRSGLLTAVTAVLTLSTLAEFPITSNAGSWYFGTAITALIAIIGTAACAYQMAVAGKNWLGNLMLKN